MENDKAADSAALSRDECPRTVLTTPPTFGVGVRRSFSGFPGLPLDARQEATARKCSGSCFLYDRRNGRRDLRPGAWMRVPQAGNVANANKKLALCLEKARG